MERRFARTLLRGSGRSYCHLVWYPLLTFTSVQTKSDYSRLKLDPNTGAQRRPDGDDGTANQQSGGMSSPSEETLVPLVRQRQSNEGTHIPP